MSIREGSPEHGREANRGHDWAGGVEVVVFCLAILALNWDLWQLWPERAWSKDAVKIGAGASILAVLVYSTRRCRPGLAEIGLARIALRSGWGSAATFTSVGCLALAAVGLIWGDPSLELLGDGWLGEYVPAVVGQQLALQAFMNNRLFALGKGWAEPTRLWFAVVLSSVLFAGLHAPNPGLVGLTLPAGLFWTRHFRRHLNLPALITSQFVVGAAAMALLGDRLLVHLRVGWGALEMMSTR